MSRNRCCPTCGAECEYCPGDHKLAACYKLTFALSGYLSDLCDNQALHRDSIGLGTGWWGSDLGYDKWAFVGSVSGLSGADATINVYPFYEIEGGTPVACYFSAFKPIASFATPVYPEPSGDDPPNEWTCTDRLLEDQSLYLFADVSLIPIGHAKNPYGDSAAVYVTASVGMAFAKISYGSGAFVHGLRPVRDLVYIFAGTARLEDFCSLSDEDEFVIDNDILSSLGPLDSYGRIIGSVAPFATGGSVTVTRTGKPCNPVYCFAIFRSEFHSEVDDWSDPVFYEYRLLKDDQPTDWVFVTGLCVAEYFQKLSDIAYERGSSATQCDGYPYSLPAKPTLETQCVICPAHCAAGDEFGSLECCADLYVRLHITDTTGSSGDFNIDVKISRASNLCSYSGTYDLTELDAGDPPLLGVDLTCSEDGKWQVGATSVGAGISTSIKSIDNAANGCPTVETEWGDEQAIVGQYAVEVVSVGCDCPEDGSECPEHYGFVIKRDDMTGPDYKFIKVSRSGDDYLWETSDAPSGWTIDIIPNTDDSTTGNCIVSIVISEAFGTRSWTFQAEADRHCPHNFEFAQVAKSDGAAGDMTIYFFGEVRSCEDDSTDCASTIHLGLTGTTSGTYDTIGDLTHSGSPHIWSAGVTYPTRRLVMQCQDWKKTATVQILPDGFTNIGTYTFRKVQGKFMPLCPTDWTDGWFPVGNTVDASVPALSLGVA